MRGVAAHRGYGAAAEQEIAADNRPSSLRSGGRLQLNFSRYPDLRAIERVDQMIATCPDFATPSC